MTIHSFFKILVRTKISHQDFLRLRIADRAANLAKHPVSLKELRQIIFPFFQVAREKAPFKVTDLPISGQDVMRELDLTPGPKEGLILKQRLDYVLSQGPETNTRENLLSQIKEVSGELSASG